ncbi:hypothetical protein Cgig2_010322 [Carnegiea gigantea]|uniref:Uncharacterized protein n=1 Tax=Carnegiea gigantea TaxID=171969 RepID=A0A9Q1JIA3_9CARY|nr:hypothetical protein Cgig2_010322 [Carnegiea gigantea]
MATIIGGVDDNKLNAGHQKAQIRKLTQPGRHASLINPHNYALAIQFKIATAMVVDTGRSVDIITLECLKKLKNHTQARHPDQSRLKEGGQRNNGSTFSLGRRVQKASLGTHFRSSALPLYPCCLEQTVQIRKDLDPTINDTIAGHLALAPDPKIKDTKDMTL